MVLQPCTSLTHRDTAGGRNRSQETQQEGRPQDARARKPGVGLGVGRGWGAGEAQGAATPGECRAQGRTSVETLGDDGGSLGSPADQRPCGFHCFLPPMVHQKRPPLLSPSEQSGQSSRF